MEGKLRVLPRSAVELYGELINQVIYIAFEHILVGKHSCLTVAPIRDPNVLNFTPAPFKYVALQYYIWL